MIFEVFGRTFKLTFNSNIWHGNDMWNILFEMLLWNTFLIYTRRFYRMCFLSVFPSLDLIILYPLVIDFIYPNGNGLRNWNSIHINTNMFSLKMSGERTLKVLKNLGYGQIKFGNQNLKNTKVWKLRADWKVHNHGWTLQICNNKG